ncbi:MAG: geranylgeranyl diphosphate synthase, type [Acidobacteriota bacterium]|jgi:geranylgeranyl diphosphate synthase type II|nr:geranylgeranyl diphosphate synthase, type [Acidobacteriota bacterium]
MPRAVSDYFTSRRRLVDDYLSELASRTGAPAPLAAPLQRSLTSPGKRVRAILMIATGEAFGCRAEKVLPAAAAIEMIHASSLVLDDLPSMDDALLRRGQPTLHREFGEDLAILSAVALLNHSYGLVAQAHADCSPRRWPMQQVLQRVVDAVGWDGTIAGEAVDLHSEGSHLDFNTLEFIHSRKTGTLFVAAAAVGAMLANVHPAPLQRVEVFAKNLGLAFQITDDVLDVTSNPEILGKDVGKDVQRLTFVKLAGVDGARKLSEELVETSLTAIEPLGAAAKPLRELALVVRDRVR